MMGLLLVLFVENAVAGTDSDSVMVAAIQISGNARTHNYILLREMQFKSGDTISRMLMPALINQSRLNLLNTSLFNFVTIDTVFRQSNDGLKQLEVTVSVLERWYVWPVPIMQITDRNFNAWWQSRDFTRINYGLDIKWYNFTGRMDEFDAIVQFGKNQHFALAYKNPYLDKKKRFGAGIEAGYLRNREAGFITQHDKLQFAFDKNGLLTEKYFALSVSLRNSIFTSHQLDAGFRSATYSDTLQYLNPEYSYADEDGISYLYLYYKLKLDHRDIKYYPLKGWYADVELSKSGLGLSFEKPVNVSWVKTTTRAYFQVGKRCYAGLSFIGKVSSKAWQPYSLMRALGYSRDYVRGYEYYVVDGKHFGLFRSTVKYALIPEHTRSIGFIPAPKFGKIHYALYLTAFADAAYVWQPQAFSLNTNLLPESFLFGTGAGIDFVTYYDKVVRVEFAVNKLGESGIFIHFIAGI